MASLAPIVGRFGAWGLGRDRRDSAVQPRERAEHDREPVEDRGDSANRRAHLVAVPVYESEKVMPLHASSFVGRFFSRICACFTRGTGVVLLAGTVIGLPGDALDWTNSMFEAPHEPGAPETETVKLYDENREAVRIHDLKREPPQSPG